MITDEELTRRLGSEGAAARGDIVAPPAVVTALVSETHSASQSRSIRRRLLAGALGAVIVGGGVAATPAAADAIHRFLAQTDITFGGTEVIKGSPFVDTSAPDLGAYIQTIYPAELRLAPGQTRAGVIEHVRSECAANPGITQAITIQRMLDDTAYQGWINEWIAAHAAGDAARMKTASGIITDAASWPAFVATDGGGVTYIMAGFAKEIAAGNADAAQELAQTEGASSWDGVDRMSGPGSYYSKCHNEYLAHK